MLISTIPLYAISIRQPWASLIIEGSRGIYKDVENRTWTTRIRGLIAIHAAKEFDQAGYNWLRVHRPELPLTSPADCPHGGIIGSVNLVDCVSSHSSLWFSGPYGFVLERPQPCPFIPHKGRLGFFPISWPTNRRSPN